jgi:hypothetical protein
MNHSATLPYSAYLRGISFALAALMLPFLLVGCEIVEIDQPSEAEQGEVIEIHVTIGHYAEDDTPWHGVFSVLVPLDWEFVSASYEGDPGSGDMLFSEAWADSTSIVLPPPDGMKWIGMISEHPHPVPSDFAFTEGTVRLKVGDELGTFNLGYFFTSDAFATKDIAFSESGEYDDNSADKKLDVPITVVQATSTEEGANPRTFALGQNYPNPFSAGTRIAYALERDAGVRVVIFDPSGREVAAIDEGQRSTGSHTAEFDGTGLPSGSYLYRLEVDGQPVQTRLMTRVR